MNLVEFIRGTMLNNWVIWETETFFISMGMLNNPTRSECETYLLIYLIFCLCVINKIVIFVIINKREILCNDLKQ
jgi:hypothetical protein